MSQQYGVKISDLDAGHPGVILYGVTTDNQLIPVQISDAGILSSPSVGATPSGSTHSFFADASTLALGASFAPLTFSFTSFSISVFNDSNDTLEFSFNGSTVHGRLLVSEATAMDYRAQTHIFLRSVSGLTGSYRVMAY